MCRRVRKHCRGATTVEFAICCPIVLFLMFATIVGAMGVFRYQQVAALAREGARWACVHGGTYAEETGNPAGTPVDIYENAIKPMSATLDLTKLSYEVTWNKNNMPLNATDSFGTPQGNTVTVTVTYEWLPEMLLIGPYSLTSTSTAQMIY